MKKSNYAELINRGLVTDDDVGKYSQLSNKEILTFLCSKLPMQRSIAAKIIIERRDTQFVTPLIKALLVEKKLYSKISISDALGSLSKVSIEKCIPYLGKIGANQYKLLPSKPFEKSNYPLPRDIVARTICKGGSIAIPILLENLDTRNIEQLSEGIDAIGYISYYRKDIIAKDYLLKLMDQYKADNLILWKLIRALQAFPCKDVINHLQIMVEQTEIKQLKWEAERSLLQINKRA